VGSAETDRPTDRRAGRRAASRVPSRVWELPAPVRGPGVGLRPTPAGLGPVQPQVPRRIMWFDSCAVGRGWPGRIRGGARVDWAASSQVAGDDPAETLPLTRLPAYTRLILSPAVS
jgi:hypothetical protein